MTELSIIYPNLTPLSDQQQLRLNKINEIKDYFVTGIKEIKHEIKHDASFNDLNKSLIVLSVTTGSIFVASFATIVRTPVGIA